MSATPPTHELTPRERLVHSRKTIVLYMTHEQHPTTKANGAEFGLGGETQMNSPWGMVQDALHTWWHNHPLHLAFDLAQPIIRKYAEEHPLKLLGLAAGAGAVMMMLRPWRLIPMGGLLMGVFKSAGVSSVLLSFLANYFQQAHPPAK